VCSDHNECEYENGGCVHYCHNTHGNYSCSCLAGFQLSRDAHNCIGTRLSSLFASLSVPLPVTLISLGARLSKFWVFDNSVAVFREILEGNIDQDPIFGTNIVRVRLLLTI